MYEGEGQEAEQPPGGGRGPELRVGPWAGGCGLRWLVEIGPCYPAVGWMDVSGRGGNILFPGLLRWD